jgi:hypothetical protein
LWRVRPKTLALTLLLGGALALPPGLRADIVAFDFLPANTYSGTAPAGSLTVTLTDVAGGVQLVLTSNLAPGENVAAKDGFFLNVTSNVDPTSLNFKLTSSTGFSTPAEVSTSRTGNDGGASKAGFKAGPDGYFNIEMTYNLTGGTKAFTTGESQTYLITGGGITADDFLQLSFEPNPKAGNPGPFYAATHVQNTPGGGGGSAWVSGSVGPDTGPGDGVVPEPPSAVLLGLGVLGLGGAWLWRRRHPVALA